MEQMFRLLFVGLLCGLSLSLEAEQCRNLYKGGYQTSFCCDTSSGRTCLTTFIGTDSRPVRKSFDEASRWCNSSVPGSSLIIIDSLESLRNMENFIGRQGLADETIITDAQKLSARDSTEWSWVNGHPTIPMKVRNEQFQGIDAACVEYKQGQSLIYCTGVRKTQFRYICEYSESNSTFSYRYNNKSFVASEEVATWYDARKECLRLEGDLASITNLQMIGKWSRLKERQNQKYWIGLHRPKWIWNSTGAALTYTNWEDGYPDESFDKQCICINPQCRRKNYRNSCVYDGKWRACNCNHYYAIVCQNKEETPGAFTTEIVVTGRMLSSTSKDFKASVSLSDSTATSSDSSTPSSSASPSTLSTTKSQPKASTTTTKRASSEVNTTHRATTTNITKTKSTKTASSNRTSHTNPAAPNTRPNIVTTTSTKTLTTTTRAKITSATTKPVISIVTTTTITDHTAGEISGLFKSFKTKEILLVLFFVVVIFIFVAIIFMIRKRKYDRRNEGSYMKNTAQSEAVSSVYTTVVPVNRPSEGTVPPGNTIYTDVEMTQHPIPPSNNTIYASVQPNIEAVDMGKSVVYADLNFSQKGKQKPRSADKITACLSPIYSTPYEPRTSASNSEYAEPFKTDKRPTAIAPVINHNAAADQQHTYRLAKAIQLGDPNVIYSEPNKPTKSSAPTGEAVKATVPIYLNMIEVKPGAESEGVATQDPSAVYAEPIKLEKSS